MFSENRRRFLRQAAGAGVACSASTLLGSLVSAQTPLPNTNEVARVYVDARRRIAPLDRNLFGSFLEPAPGKVLMSTTITGNDLKAVNSFESPQAFDKPVTSGGHSKFEVPARSYTVIQFGA